MKVNDKIFITKFVVHYYYICSTKQHINSPVANITTTNEMYGEVAI